MLNNDWPDTNSYLFQNQRPKYLDKMPPFSKYNRKTTNAIELDGFTRINSTKDETIRIEVLKLQALLASNYLPVECLREIEQFLDHEEVDGSLAFRTLCNQNTEAVAVILVEECPEALLQFAKVID